MEVKISAKKKSANDIACFYENREMSDHMQAWFQEDTKSISW
jgi:hypothetical protein